MRLRANILSNPFIMHLDDVPEDGLDTCEDGTVWRAEMLNGGVYIVELYLHRRTSSGGWYSDPTRPNHPKWISNMGEVGGRTIREALHSLRMRKGRFVEHAQRQLLTAHAQEATAKLVVASLHDNSSVSTPRHA